MGINERIKNRRIELDLTLHYISEKIGVSEATVQRYESGEIKNLKQETIEKLAKVLKVTPSYLMGWKENKDSVEEKIENSNDKFDTFLDNLTDNKEDEEFTKSQLKEIDNYKKYIKSKNEKISLTEYKMKIDKAHQLLDALLKEGMITDVNNIDKQTQDKILDAVKIDLKMQMGKK